MKQNRIDDAEDGGVGAMPRASVATATRVKAGDLCSCRKAKRRSFMSLGKIHS
jgi:hypothetical protein